MQTKKSHPDIQKAIDTILSEIIDEWYQKVSGYYVTQERLESNPGNPREEELKRFHDDRGHRIKFNKDDLDFTYGLKSNWQSGILYIEVSVNNKVPNFDYDDFQERLLSHYERAGNQKIQTPADLRTCTHKDVFQLVPSLREAFTVEKREDKADIMRLSFGVNSQFLDKLASHPVASRQLVENYCVSPFRSVYATVYRRSR